MARLLDPVIAARIRADIADAKRPAPEITFVDRIAAIERAVEAILCALEAK
jgi:ATP-dependent Zn protease